MNMLPQVLGLWPPHLASSHHSTKTRNDLPSKHKETEVYTQAWGFTWHENAACPPPLLLFSHTVFLSKVPSKDCTSSSQSTATGSGFLRKRRTESWWETRGSEESMGMSCYINLEEDPKEQRSPRLAIKLRRGFLDGNSQMWDEHSENGK